MSKSSTPPSGNIDAMEKTAVSEVERVATHDRVPGHSNYYEKNGLRTYGDDEDHDHEPRVCPSRSCPLSTDLWRVDVFSTLHESGGHGLFVDWIADSGLYFW